MEGCAMGRSNLSVLVADDHENTRKVFVRTLSSLGFSCDEAKDGRECLAKFSTNLYDIVFLDLVMPEIDGDTVLRWIKSRAPGTDVVVASVQDDVGIIRQVLAAGARAYLVKPVSEPQISAVMNGVQNRRTASGRLMAACA